VREARQNPEKHLRRADKPLTIKSHHRKEPDFAVYKCEPSRETRQPVDIMPQALERGWSGEPKNFFEKFFKKGLTK